MRRSIRRRLAAIIGVLCLLLVSAVTAVSATSAHADDAWPTTGWHTSSDSLGDTGVSYQVKDGVLYMRPTPKDGDYSKAASESESGTFSNSDSDYKQVSELTSDGIQVSPGPYWQPKWFDDAFGTTTAARSKITAIKAQGKIAFPIMMSSGIPAQIDLDSCFAKLPNLTDISGLSHLDMSNVFSLESAFAGDTSLADLTPLSEWSVATVLSFDSMFKGDSSITTLGNVEANDSTKGLAAWGTNAAMSFSSMFEDCSKLSDISAVENWYSANVLTLSDFLSGTSVENLTPLSGWDVGNVLKMDRAFRSNKQLTSLSGLESWTTSKLTSMDSAFSGDTGLTSLSGLGSWTTSTLTSMSGAFQGCTKLTDITALKNWDVSKVTSFKLLFSGDYALTTLDGLEDWDTSSVTSLQSLFSNDYHLKDLSALKNWDLGKVTTANAMFYVPMTLKPGYIPWERLGVPSVANHGEILLAEATDIKQSIRAVPEDDQDAEPTEISTLYSLMSADDATTKYPTGKVWVRYVGSWTAHFDGNGTTGAPVLGSMADVTTKVGSTLTLPQPGFFRLGYRFKGWSTQQGDTAAILAAGSAFPASSAGSPAEGAKVTFYVQWEKIVVPGGGTLSDQGGMLPGWVQTDSSGTQGTIGAGEVSEASFTNKYSPKTTTFSFRLTKLVDGGVPAAGQRYSFLLKDSTGATVQTATNSGSSVVFRPLTFSQTGEYVYHVTEDATSVPATMKADTHDVEIIVNVYKGADSSDPDALTAHAQYVGDMTFDNTSKPASLTLAKKVTGTSATKTFTLHVVLKDAQSKPVTGTYSGVTFDSNGGADVTLSASAGHEGLRTISGLPANTSYTVTEPDNLPGYTLTGIEHPSGTLAADSSVTATATNAYKAAPAEVYLQATKRVTLGPDHVEGGPMTAGEYGFTLCEVTQGGDGSASGASTGASTGASAGDGSVGDGSTSGDGSAGACEGVSEATNTADGTITFKRLLFDAPGTHTYRMREKPGTESGTTYDTVVHAITITVTDNGRGQLVASESVDGGTAGAVNGTKPVFTNHRPQIGTMPSTGRMGVAPFALLALVVFLGGAWLAFVRRG